MCDSFLLQIAMDYLILPVKFFCREWHITWPANLPEISSILYCQGQDTRLGAVPFSCQRAVVGVTLMIWVEHWNTVTCSKVILNRTWCRQQEKFTSSILLWCLFWIQRLFFKIWCLNCVMSSTCYQWLGQFPTDLFTVRSTACSDVT